MEREQYIHFDHKANTALGLIQWKGKLSKQDNLSVVESFKVLYCVGEYKTFRESPRGDLPYPLEKFVPLMIRLFNDPTASRWDLEALHELADRLALRESCQFDRQYAKDTAAPFLRIAMDGDKPNERLAALRLLRSSKWLFYRLNAPLEKALTDPDETLREYALDIDIASLYYNVGTFELLANIFNNPREHLSLRIKAIEMMSHVLHKQAYPLNGVLIALGLLSKVLVDTQEYKAIPDKFSDEGRKFVQVIHTALEKVVKGIPEAYGRDYLKPLYDRKPQHSGADE